MGVGEINESGKLIVMGVGEINESGKTDCDGGGRDQWKW